MIADPERFDGATLADPLEGVAYGICKAQVHAPRRRRCGSTASRMGAPSTSSSSTPRRCGRRSSAPIKAKVVELFLDLALTADLNAIEIDSLRRMVAEKSGTGLRELSTTLKAAQAKRAAQQAREARARRRAARQDPRPTIDVPEPDDAWLPVVEAINEVLGAVTVPEPPTRDIDGVMNRAGKLALPNMHLWGATDASLPPPEQWLLRRMGEIETSEIDRALHRLCCRRSFGAFANQICVALRAA